MDVVDPPRPHPRTGPGPGHGADHPPRAGLSHEARARLTAELLARASVCDDDAERASLRRQVVEANHRVAVAVATRYRDRGLLADDLEQVASEGLVKAVARFDVSWDRDLLSFAVPTIRGEVQRHFRDHSSTIRPPRRVQSLQRELAQAVEDLRARLGREPTRSEVGSALEVDGSELDALLGELGGLHPLSLDQPIDGTAGLSLGDALPATSSDDDVAGVAEARATVLPLLRDLTPRDRLLVFRRFFEERTQREIGEELGLSQMQVSRLLARALDQMRCQLDGPGAGAPAPGVPAHV